MKNTLDEARQWLNGAANTDHAESRSPEVPFLVIGSLNDQLQDTCPLSEAQMAGHISLMLDQMPQLNRNLLYFLYSNFFPEFDNCPHMAEELHATLELRHAERKPPEDLKFQADGALRIQEIGYYHRCAYYGS